MSRFFDQMRHEIDRMLMEPGFGKCYSAPWRPAFDVYELEDKVVILVDLPGVTAQEINITFNKGVLTITGARKDPAPEGLLKIHHMEIDRGGFVCRIMVGLGVRVDKVQAVQRDGYLTIELPKGG